MIAFNRARFGVAGAGPGIDNLLNLTDASDIWPSPGALVLEPNARGSAGHGEKFRSLNVRNPGIADAWDVLSGIDKLAAGGLVDPSRAGAMRWSQDKGFGHPLNEPKVNRGAMQHNLDWFNKYLWPATGVTQ
jgi:hypothetical protein